MNRTTALLVLLVALLASTTVWGDAPVAKKKTPSISVKQVIGDVKLKTTLAGAFSQIQKLSGVSIEPDWTALAAAGVKATDQVSVEATAATLGGLLDRTLAAVDSPSARLGWCAEDDGIIVTTRQNLLGSIRLDAAMAQRRSAAEPTTTPADVAAAAPAGKKNGDGTMNFDDVPLRDVVSLFRDISGLNFSVNWKSLELTGVGPTTPVSLKATSITLARALDLVTDQISSSNGGKLGRVYWLVDDGVVRIATGEAFNDKLSTRVVNIADLLVVIPDFEGPRMDFNRTAGNNGSNSSLWTNNNSNNTPTLTMARQRQQTADNLIDAIKESIGKDMWTDGGGKGSIRLMGKKLVISQTLLGFKLLNDAGQMH